MTSNRTEVRKVWESAAMPPARMSKRAAKRTIRVGIDTGGTFTDLIGIDESSGALITGKYPTSQSHAVQSIGEVVRDSHLDAERTASIVVGTTLGLNSLLQRKGATVIFVTTAGFEDVLFIQRMNRRYHYSYSWTKPAPLVERRNCVGVRERIDSRGTVLVPVTSAELERLGDEIEARLAVHDPSDCSIAVCLLFAYLNPQHENELKKYLGSRLPAIPISVSHEIAPIWREYERGCTTVVDAFIKPTVARYISAVSQSFTKLDPNIPWTIMKSNGGHAMPSAVQGQPVNTVLSGLSGGIIGAKYFGAMVGEKNLVTLDMGGTSCDVGLVKDGALSYVTNYEIEWGIPISAPFVDVSSIGAGGGSIARVDKGGFLRVGPQSAGAEPGPACYGQGGSEATVTDANLVLGRLDPDYFLGGKMKLDAAKAESAVSNIAKQLNLDLPNAAQAIIDVADENMANAIRVISVERGLDPRAFALVCFGGAGPLHSSGIAEKVGIERVIVPLHPGLCSAFGTLIADFQVDKMKSIHLRSTDAEATTIETLFHDMQKSAIQELKNEGFRRVPILRRSISMRYAGQNYEHEVQLDRGALTARRLELLFEKFHKLHQSYYGYSISREVIQMIKLTVSVIGVLKLPKLKNIHVGKLPPPKQCRSVYFKERGYMNTPVYNRDSLPAGTRLNGPAVVEEVDSTILLNPANSLQVTSKGIITVSI